MIVDSTALMEQAVRDVLRSAFQSAGQRCSALRLLYIQDEIYDDFLTMLIGAMDELILGNPWDYATDIGPFIDQDAFAKINDYLTHHTAAGSLLKSLVVPDTGYSIAPSVIELDDISDLKEEIFGPILHIVRYSTQEFSDLPNRINKTEYGLTFGMHSRIDSRVDYITKKIHVGNIYINRDQIGAVVGSQPFGGNGLSGTGPKAGGQFYLQAFMDYKDATEEKRPELEQILQGPTGESNLHRLYPKGHILCMGPDIDQLQAQVNIVLKTGNGAIAVSQGDKSAIDKLKTLYINENLNIITGDISIEDIIDQYDPQAIIWQGHLQKAKELRLVLASKSDKITPLIHNLHPISQYYHEQSISIDITAAGGNASLLMQTDV